MKLTPHIEQDMLFQKLMEYFIKEHASLKVDG